MSDTQTVLAILDRWLAQGWLAPLDRAFADFLLQLEADCRPELLWAGALVSRQFGRGEIGLDLSRLSQNPEAALALSDSQALVELPALSESQWQAALAESTLVDCGDGAAPLVLDGNMLYLRRFWRCKQTVQCQIQRRLQPVRDDLPDSIAAAVQALFAGNTETPDWQKIACVLALRARFGIITGGPGTGKTTTLTRLLSLLVQLALDSGERPPAILLAAPTGKAAARVSASIANALTKLEVEDAVKAHLPRQASTLHRLLGSRPGSRRFSHDTHHRLVADIVIVDEASMIDLEMMAALLNALPDAAQLILLGDKDQLASVEAGAVMGELCAGAERAAYDEASRAWIVRYAGITLPAPESDGSAVNQQTVMLRHSHRFGADSGIGQLADAVNRGDAMCALGLFGGSPHRADLAKLTLPHAADSRLKALVLRRDDELPGYGDYRNTVQTQRPSESNDYDAWAQAVLEAFDRFRLLCAVRQGDWGVESLNRLIERWLFPQARPDSWYEGRPVMVTRNDYNLNLMNGDIGIALRDANARLRVVFPSDNGLRWISPMRVSDVETAYAMTVHKSQGSEFDHVALMLPDVPSPVLTRELVYTGITRARKHFTLITANESVVASAIARSGRSG